MAAEEEGLVLQARGRRLPKKQAHAALQLPREHSRLEIIVDDGKEEFLLRIFARRLCRSCHRRHRHTADQQLCFGVHVDINYNGSPLRLRRWIRALEGRMVRLEEGLVLHARGKGLPRTSRHGIISLPNLFPVNDSECDLDKKDDDHDDEDDDDVGVDHEYDPKHDEHEGGGFRALHGSVLIIWTAGDLYRTCCLGRSAQIPQRRFSCGMLAWAFRGPE
mmetsp:Transcript_107789/g.310423  ORF Transcript_107789/g.310423 Transcript_107789/m.310423 type:complete len:219 (-) Transcript_107789:472-1128(-)